MPTVDELRERVRKPLERELAMGCQKRVVTVGLEALLGNVGQPLPKVRAALDGYGGMDPDERRVRILEALKHEASTLDHAVNLYSGKLEADLIQIVSAYQALLQARAPLMLAVYTEVARQPELATIFEYPKRVIQKMLEMLVRYQTEGKLMRKEPMQQLAELFGPVMMLMLFETVYRGESNFDTKAHIKGFLKSNGK